MEAALREAKDDGRARFDVAARAASGADARRPRSSRPCSTSASTATWRSPADAVASASASYYGRNVTNRIDLRTMERTVSAVLVGRRLASAGLDPGKVKDLTRELDMKTIRHLGHRASARTRAPPRSSR